MEGVSLMLWEGSPGGRVSPSDYGREVSRGEGVGGWWERVGCQKGFQVADPPFLQIMPLAHPSSIDTFN